MLEISGKYQDYVLYSYSRTHNHMNSHYLYDIPVYLRIEIRNLQISLLRDASCVGGSCVCVVVGLVVGGTSLLANFEIGVYVQLVCVAKHRERKDLNRLEPKRRREKGLNGVME